MEEHLLSKLEVPSSNTSTTIKERKRRGRRERGRW
jgi:hypothetical protein